MNCGPASSACGSSARCTRAPASRSDPTFARILGVESAHCVDAAKDEHRHEPSEDRLEVVSYPCRKIAIRGSPMILAAGQGDSRLPEDERDRVLALQDEVVNLLEVRRPREAVDDGAQPWAPR